NLATQGEIGRLRISQLTRLITVPLAFLQALGQSAIFVREGVLDANTFGLFGPHRLETLAILVALTAGTMLLVWIGELITERGVGHGLLAGSSETTYIPMQVNSTGMIPLIFAQSILIFPALLSQYLIGNSVKWLSSGAFWVGTYLANTSLWYYWFTYFALVVL